MRNQYRYIGEQSEWDAVVDDLRQAPRLTVDTERNGRFAYREQICLIQISDGLGTFLLDPLSVKRLDGLGEALANEAVQVVMHGCEEDVRFFDRDFGFTVSNLFDTGMAARFLGVPRPNLGAVLEEFCGVGIDKDPKLQVSHWGLRPLSGPALDYAASDVHHLLPLADELEYRLDKLGRVKWLEEECERISSLRYPPEEPLESAFRRVKGWETLDSREAAVLRELYAFRDGKACAWDVPPTQAASNRDLLELAQCDGRPPRGIGGMLASRCFGELVEAIEKGMSGPEAPKPPRADRGNEMWTHEARERLKTLKQWRAGLGHHLNLAVSHIWPTGSLERIALAPERLDGELRGGDGDVRRWQLREFGNELSDLVGRT